jgi:hypothetical protein
MLEEEDKQKMAAWSWRRAGLAVGRGDGRGRRAGRGVAKSRVVWARWNGAGEELGWSLADTSWRRQLPCAVLPIGLSAAAPHVHPPAATWAPLTSGPPSQTPPAHASTPKTLHTPCSPCSPCSSSTMADVRSLLRQERAARQQAKPPKRSAAPAAAPTSRKRKAVDDDEATEERKRTRTEEEAGVPAGFFDDGAAHEERSASADASHAAKDAGATHTEAMPHELHVPAPQAPPNAADDAELDAFLNEMDQKAQTQRETARQYAGVVAEAAPMTTAELAAQAREDMSAQRAKRDEEMEGEKEDAARALEDEFDEMEGLEERMKKLREQREALRNKHVVATADDVVVPAPQPEEEDVSDSEDEGWDDWSFRPS